jgi:TRAP-type C4-dicarboxylate transport system permease small subunit
LLLKTAKGIRSVGNILAGIGGILLLFLMLLDTIDPLGRYIFNHPIAGTVEISKVLMGAMVLLSWAYTQRNEGHVAIDMLLNRYPFRVRGIVKTIFLSAALALFILIIWRSTIIAFQYTQQQRVTAILNLPDGLFHFFVPTGAFFLCLEFIVQIITNVAEIKKGKQDVAVND